MSGHAGRHGLADDAQLTMHAAALIRLGARLQMLEIECGLPRDRLVRLYREVRGGAAPKGLLPSSTDWYMTWFANIHASLFHSIYRFLRNRAGCPRLEALVKAYTLYAEHGDAVGLALPLDLTRAWMLVRFVDAGVLDIAQCRDCGAAFITYRHALRRHPVCVACRLPPRAGKRAAGETPCVAPGARRARRQDARAAVASCHDSGSVAGESSGEWRAV
ncbi:FlhC family transcriptional regulator [Burkholderia lata]|uniref:Flagellar transcriptional regulator FlhC n=1 Tax=Burkholderia lata (strain ATCC 17760 / DSM 23089 / LMG 22485 / NCIMB 9086 / R18194 / 383) TaxID=482957 RepID=A0A6P2ME67_BURL3|nr:FlhC family transcriptional regulator [Burkholderia lata]VWB78214.1 transcriptional activator FlhC [Burkholderia lata]VWC29304.1 transcriptional activator FlhC [Burkholderia lata]VWC84876.1 transcriptional activator FlhC [Burkholderia lata]